MRRLSQVIGALILVLSTASLASAGEAAATAAIGMGLSVVGIGVGLGLVGMGALGGMARQPEMLKALQTQMIIVAALVEGAGILAIIFCLLTIFI